MTNGGLNRQNILGIFIGKNDLASSDIYADLKKHGLDISLVTVKRLLGQMAKDGVLEISGAGRSVKYNIGSRGRLFTNIDAATYCAIDPDKRYGQKNYNFELFAAFPAELFTNEEKNIVETATATYHSRVSDSSATIQEKELERFVIELSWKSSKIEGNTYTLLDTEKLISQGIEAPGHDKREAIMILNHKNAFKFVHENSAIFKNLTRAGLEEIHKILVSGLNVNLGFRKKPVGVTGSIYRPLDNPHQIAEAVEALGHAVSRAANAYTKAFIALIGISYVQPFEDGNKRTARLVANAILLAYGLAPLSYRSVDEKTYRETTLVFYELNSLVAFKKIFIEQYDFAARNYAVK